MKYTSRTVRVRNFGEEPTVEVPFICTVVVILRIDNLSHACNIKMCEIFKKMLN